MSFDYISVNPKMVLVIYFSSLMIYKLLNVRKHKMDVKRVGILTAGGLAPCLSSAIAGLIENYTKIDPSIEIICYLSGYKGLLLGDSIEVTEDIREKATCSRVFRLDFNRNFYKLIHKWNNY